MFEINPDAALPVSPDQAFRRGRAGFLEGFELSRQAQIRAKGQFAIENNFIDEEQRLFEELGRAGHTGYRPLSYFLGRAQFNEAFDMEAEAKKRRGGLFGYDLERDLEDYPNAPAKVTPALSALFEDGEVPDYVKRALGDYNRQFRNLEGTGLQAMAERGVASEILNRANAAAMRAMGDAARVETTTLGDVGFFTGGMAGYIDPKTNPLATATLPFGGPGRSVLTRVAAEAVVQAGIEGAIQATGGQEQQRRLGLPSGIVPALEEIAMAGAAGGAFQLLGEGAVAAVKKMFPNFREPATRPRTDQTRPEADVNVPGAAERAVPDPARPPEGPPRFDGGELPYGPGRVGNTRAAMDLEGMRRDLGSWDGATPLNSMPQQLRGTTALSGPDTAGIQFAAARGDPGSPLAVAQLVDPPLAREWEKLQQRKENLRADLERATAERGTVAEEGIAEATARVTDLERQVEKLRADIEGAQKKARRQKLRRVLQEKEAKLEDARAVRQELERSTVGPDGELVRAAPTPKEAAIRQRLIETDERLRDLAPAFSRAAAAGRGDFRLAGAAPTLEDLTRAINEGRDVNTIVDKALEDFTAAETALRADPGFPEPAPIRTAEEIRTETFKPEADPRLDEGVNDLLAQIADENAEFVNFGGRSLRLSDSVLVPGEDGVARQMTVREAIEDLGAEDDVMAAFTTCRIA